MDLLKKVETLLNATVRAKLPRRERRSVLDEQEEQLLAEMRRALAEVEAQERVLAKRLKTEQTQAQEAAQRGDRAEQRAHEQRAAELERHLESEGIQAIDLEEKLAALEEKLALAKEAVEKQARVAALKEEEAARVIGEINDKVATGSSNSADSAQTERPLTGPDDDPKLDTRKARLSE